jgi:hypothetical protein
MHAQLGGARQARNTKADTARPWPSVKQPTVRTDRPGGTDDRPLYVRGRRNTAVYIATPVTHHETEKRRPA